VIFLKNKIEIFQNNLTIFFQYRPGHEWQPYRRRLQRGSSCGVLPRCETRSCWIKRRSWLCSSAGRRRRRRLQSGAGSHS